MPTVVGATFSPSQADVVAGDELQELLFQVTVARASGAAKPTGYIDIYVGPLLIGQVPISFEMQDAAGQASVESPAFAELLQVANASMFDAIFISYSHKDSQIVDLCVGTYNALGVDVLVDRNELRSGDDWRATLQQMIEGADIFQLYWSDSAAASKEVEHEWRQALALSTTRDRFIRPLYWDPTRPDAPPELNGLHFGRLDLTALRRTAKAYTPDKSGLLRRAISALLRR
jgi:hypothetical protein